MKQFEGLITFERQIFHKYSITSLTASPYVVIGSDNVQQKVAIEILCEIRFIRKEEVRSEYIPSHCGLEMVDFLCSMIAGKTRLEESRTLYPTIADIELGTFLNIRFEDGEIISFYDSVMEKIC